MKKTTDQASPTPPHLRNPSGKGGFGDNPQNRNSGGAWNPENTISYQYKRFMNMNSDEFTTWQSSEDYDNATLAMTIAYNAAKKAKDDFYYLREVTDRTEGKPKVSVDHTTGGEKFEAPTIINMGGNGFDEDDTEQ